MIILRNLSDTMTSLPSGNNIIMYEGSKGGKKAHVYRARGRSYKSVINLGEEKKILFIKDKVNTILADTSLTYSRLS